VPLTKKELNKIFKDQGITARKYMGDDSQSWAVFKQGRPVVTGLNRSLVDYYKKQVAGV
jgi:hypothetical protein